MLPKIIQGGMGVGVSGWQLARSVSRLGQLGVVSGTALAVLMIRRLQQGDPGGHFRRAFHQFPIPDIAQRVLSRHFVAGGKDAAAPFRLTPVPTISPGAPEIEATVLANFAEVFLAKEGHGGSIGINYLEKIQFPTIPSLYGAMLAGVDYVLMGAGIPRAIPGLLDGLTAGEPQRLKLDVLDALPGEEYFLSFDPRQFSSGTLPTVTRPRFLAIVASATLALALARKATGKVDGFVIEGPTAGGHNAPPRGHQVLSESGEPVYGPRDYPDLGKFRDLGVPFWLAGSYAHPNRLREALNAGATGIQVGTAFAFCEESGIEPGLKQQVIEACIAGHTRVFTDPVASPTGFPFKVVQFPGSVSDPEVYNARTRLCDLGYLRQAYRKPDGSLGYRCPAEPVADYLRKGGELSDTVGRKCVCNGLLATMGLGQVFGPEAFEKPLLTAGDDLPEITRFIKPGTHSYKAADVLAYLLEPEVFPVVPRGPQPLLVKEVMRSCPTC
jgi:nitronate monooxygenase